MPMSAARRVAPATSADQQAFLPILPWVESHAAVRFRHLDVNERAEATAAATSRFFVSFLSVRAQGKNPSAFPSAIATYAVLAVNGGRRIEGGSTSRDALAPASRRSFPSATSTDAFRRGRPLVREVTSSQFDNSLACRLSKGQPVQFQTVSRSPCRSTAT